MNDLKPTDPVPFGRLLLELRDLDPVYEVLHLAELEPPLLKRWLLAYMCFYNVSTASWVADRAIGYWDRMRRAAGSKDFPRSSERRHFRGDAAMKSVAWLAERGVNELFEPLLEQEPITARELTYKIRTWEKFGKWAAFKLADIIERLGLREVDFSEADELLFESPRHGAEDMWCLRHPGVPLPVQNGGVTAWALKTVSHELRDKFAPPRYERPIGYQEAETVICKFHSCKSGSYEPGEDVEALERFLRGPLTSGTASRLYTAGKRGELW